MKKIKENWFEEWANEKLNGTENVCCPFCGQKIKGPIPKGLSLKKVMEVINKIKEVI